MFSPVMFQESKSLSGHKKERLEIQEHFGETNSDVFLQIQQESSAYITVLASDSSSCLHISDECGMRNPPSTANLPTGIEQTRTRLMTSRDADPTELSANGRYYNNCISDYFEQTCLAENHLHREFEKAHKHEIRNGRERKPFTNSENEIDGESSTLPKIAYHVVGSQCVEADGRDNDHSPFGHKCSKDCEQDYFSSDIYENFRLHKDLRNRVYEKKDCGTTISIKNVYAEKTKPTNSEKCVHFPNLKQRLEKADHTITQFSSLGAANKELKNKLHSLERKMSELELRRTEETNRNRLEMGMLGNELQPTANNLKSNQIDCFESTEQNYKLNQSESENVVLIEAMRDEIAKKQRQLQSLEKKYNYVKDKILHVEENNKACVTELKLLAFKYINLKKHAKILEVEKHHNLQIKKRLIERTRQADIENLNLCNENNILTNKNAALIKSSEKMKEEIHYCKENLFKLVEGKQMLGEHIHKLQEKNKELVRYVEQADMENETTKALLSTKDLEITRLIKKLQGALEDLKTLSITLSEYEVETKSLNFQIEQMRTENSNTEKELERHCAEYKVREESAGNTVRSLQNECQAISKMAADLKEDKNLLNGKLQQQRQEKMYLSAERKKLCKEIEKLKETVQTLEREKDILQKELDTMRVDYLNLSDRITSRINSIGGGGKEKIPNKFLTEDNDLEKNLTIT